MNEDTRWRRMTELQDETYKLLLKIGGSLNPSSVIATVDEDGSPRTAPFGSLHAISKQQLRIVVNRHHDTLDNIKRDPRVMICLTYPPDIAISIKGRAEVVAEPWTFDEHYAIVEIAIIEIKNDLPRSVFIESGITISATGPFVEWWKSCYEELNKR